MVGGIEKTPAVILVVSFVIILFYAPLYGKIADIVLIPVIWVLLARLNYGEHIFVNVAITYAFQQKFYYAQALETKRKGKKKVTFHP